MVTRVVTRADDYLENRPVYRYRFAGPEINPETEEPEPFNLAGSTVRATFKAEPTDPNTDPTDENAAIKADIVFASDGTITSSTNWALPPGKAAVDGELLLTLTKAFTKTLALDAVLISDVQVTDAADRTQTIKMIGTLEVEEGITNRDS